MCESFLKKSVKIAVPVALQAMLQSSFSMIDQIMVGQLGTEQMAENVPENFGKHGIRWY